MGNTDEPCPMCESGHTLRLRYPDTPNPGDEALYCLDCHYEEPRKPIEVPAKPACADCDRLQKRVKELEAELDRHRCSICGRIGCTNDHGYDGGGPDWG